jgi:hypothetical protein
MMEIEMPGKSLRERRRAGPARVNERAINIKQNQSYHPEKLPEFEIFREIFQESCRVATPAIAGVLPTGGSQKGLAGKTPALPGNSGVQAFGLRVSRRTR